MKLLLQGGGEWQPYFARFDAEHVLARLHEIDVRIRRDGLSALKQSDDPLVALGMEISPAGVITKNGYGVFDLAWQGTEHPEWAARIVTEVEGIRNRISHTHGVPLRFLIWAGMGGSVEDKSMYEAMGLLRGIRFYALDSTDPAKLKAILADIEHRAGLPLKKALPSTLVVGMALGMTSYEPVVNLEKLAALYARLGIDGRPNFIYLTLPGSVLDQFAGRRRYQRVPLQLDDRHTTSGRHSAPLTRGALYPLALAGVDLREWIAGTALSDDEIRTAWRLASFLHAHGVAGRDKVTLLPMRTWKGVALWTKQNFEESLGKSELLGIKMVIGEQPSRAYYRAVPDPAQDRVLLVVRSRGEGVVAGVNALRRRGYPNAILEVPRGVPLSRYMQFVHYAVFGLAYLRSMNFVTQPGVELYKTIASELYEEARRTGSVAAIGAWRAMRESPMQARWHKRLTLYFEDAGAETGSKDAAAIYAALIRRLAANRSAEYGELTFFGDMRFSAQGRTLRKLLDRAADRVFRRALQMPADVYEGPAMNHSYHEMIIGHGRCVSTILLSRKQASLRAIGYGSDYHVSQFLATKMALARKGRPVIAIVMDDLSSATLEATDDFFSAAAAQIQTRRDA